MKLKKLFIILFIFIKLLNLTAQEIHLNEWDENREHTVALDGIWEFYPEQLLTPEDIKNVKDKPILLMVPGYWNNQVNQREGIGFGTYRLMVTLNKEIEGLGFRVPVISSASKVWINNKLITTTGIPGKSKDTTIPKNLPGLFPLYESSSKMDIVIQVSNFHHRDGGIWRSFYIGDYKIMSNKRDIEIAFNMLILGSLLIMGLYHITLYLQRRKDSTSLYFALLVLIIASRIPFVGLRLAVQAIPAIPWELNEKISFLTFYLTVLFANLYLYSLFPKDFSKKALKIISVISIAASLCVVFLSSLIYIHITIPFEYFTIFVMLYNIVVIIMAIIRGRGGSVIIFLGLLVFILSAANDILYYNGITNVGNIVPYGLFIFVFSQAFVLSRYYSKAFTKVENLSRVFQRFVPQRYLYHVAKDGIEEIHLGNAETEEVTVLYVDIRDFTPLSENMKPHEVLNFLNSYFERMNSPIMSNGGIIDKFMGDSIMALFDREDHNKEIEALNAVTAAVDMSKALDIYNKHRAHSGYKKISIGIGINSGPVIIGTIGSEERMDSTVIGDVVNLTTRLEGLTKHYCVNTIVSQSTRDLVREYDFDFREIDYVAVKGKLEPIKIYELLNCCTPEEREGKLKTIDIFNEAMTFYFNRKFKKAFKLFGKCLKVYPEDCVCRVFTERCRHFIAYDPGKDWDSVFRPSVK